MQKLSVCMRDFRVLQCGAFTICGILDASRYENTTWSEGTIINELKKFLFKSLKFPFWISYFGDFTSCNILVTRHSLVIVHGVSRIELRKNMKEYNRGLQSQHLIPLWGIESILHENQKCSQIWQIRVYVTVVKFLHFVWDQFHIYT